MGLHIYASNRLEVLAQQLAEIVRIPLSSPFQPETVIVQSRGMERWVSLALARHNGICANVSFPFPNAFVQQISRGIDPELPEKSPFDREIMTFRIMKQLPVCINQPGFQDLKTYLAEDERGLKLYELSQHIADAFDQYLVFRPEMIFTWESGKEDHWQARLWRELVAETEIPHHAQIRSDLIYALQHRPDLENMLPERINIFGISYLPRFHMEVLATLSGHISVNLFLMNPCREYWADIVSDHEKKQIRNLYPQRGITDTDFARLLNIAQPFWSQIKSGKRRMGASTLSGIVQNFPEFKKDVLEFLGENNHEHSQAERRPGSPSQKRS